MLGGDAGVAVQEFRVTEDSPLLAKLRDAWERHMMLAIAELPPITAGDFEAVVTGD
jgi:predicted proteasome-type protease